MIRPTDSLHLGSAPDKLVKLSDIEALIKKQMEIVSRSDDPYELDLPDFRNNPTLSLRYVLSSLSSLPTQNESPIGEWVSVSERLPDGDESYLCVAGGCIYMLDFNTDRMEFEDGGERQYRFEALYDVITHWKPLPLPPTN